MLYLLLSGLILAGCKAIKTVGDKKNAVKLYRISGVPERATAYQPGKLYIADYEVLNTYALDDSAQFKLEQILASPALIMKDINRNCEFFPAFALKWPSGKVILMSLSPCAKIQVIEKVNDGTPVDDLKEHSELESWVMALAK